MAVGGGARGGRAGRARDGPGASAAVGSFGQMGGGMQAQPARDRPGGGGAGMDRRCGRAVPRMDGLKERGGGGRLGLDDIRNLIR